MDQSGRVSSETRAHPPHARVIDVGARDLPGLAQALTQGGMSLSGTTVPPAPSSRLLGRYGVTVGAGRRAHWFPAGTSVLVHGATVGRSHPARLGALRRGVPQTTPAAWLRGTFQDRHGVAVAGGREAAVAAAMIGWVLTCAGKDPSVLLGMPSPQLGGWWRRGEGQHVVADWREGPESLAELGPDLSVILRVGADPWEDPVAWKEDWLGWAALADGPGEVLALGHPALIKADSTPPARNRCTWLSLRQGSDWWGADLREEVRGSRFRVFHRGRYVSEVMLGISGARNALSALAAVAACTRLGVSARDVREGLEGFAGVSRDFERRGSFRGVTLVDDASEEPGPVRETLALARRAFGRRRLWVVFAPLEPPGSGALGSYLGALGNADRVVMTPDPTSSHRALPGASSALVQHLVSAGVPARWEAELRGVIAELDRHLEPGDVLLTLGAGDVGIIADAFIRRLQRDHQGG